MMMGPTTMDAVVPVPSDKIPLDFTVVSLPGKVTLNDRPTRKCLCGWSTALLANVQTHQGTCVKSHGPNQL